MLTRSTIALLVIIAAVGPSFAESTTYRSDSYPTNPALLRPTISGGQVSTPGKIYGYGGAETHHFQSPGLNTSPQNAPRTYPNAGVGVRW
jgi:hypothetical protein